MSAIVRLIPYVGYNYTAELLAMSQFGISTWNPSSGVWTEVGSSFSSLPQWATHKGVTVITLGHSGLPVKYVGGGTATTTLGGSPPFAKVPCDYMKYLFLWNVVTTDGTFPRQGLYSPDYDFDWSSCNGHEINLDETPGEVRAALAQGSIQLVYKADGIAAIRFVGGSVRFQQEMLPFDEGILAPNSLQNIGNAGHIMLATDVQLYTVTQGQVKALPTRVTDKLQSTMDLNAADKAMSAVDSDRDTYYLFYKSSNPDDEYARSRIAYNFRTGEFAHRTYAGHQWLDALGLKLSPLLPVRMFASDVERVYEINDITAVNDAGTPIDRHYTTDWQSFGSGEEKRLDWVELIFKRTPGIRVKISIAIDDDTEWLYERGFDLKGVHGNDTTTLVYGLPDKCFGHRFNLRVRFFHDKAGVVGELKAIYFKWDKISSIEDTVGDSIQNSPII